MSLCDPYIEEKFFIGIGTVLSLADTSDFEDGEVRVIPMIRDYDNWDGKIPKRDPIEFDCGTDKDLKGYVYRNKNWKRLGE